AFRRKAKAQSTFRPLLARFLFQPALGLVPGNRIGHTLLNWPWNQAKLIETATRIEVHDSPGQSNAGHRGGWRTMRDVVGNGPDAERTRQCDGVGPPTIRGGQTG